MKYKAGQRRKAAEYEPALVEWWKKNKTFEKSVEQRPIDNSYVFYDGPPFITGMPHHGTLLSSIVKDAVPRFWTMRGKRVERRWGWDCHGLPAENFVEKQLGITDRREIGSKWSLEDYIVKARESMVANSETWESTIDRIGRWVDFKGAYRTMDKDFMESVWWAFKTLYDAGKIYEGRKVLMYDTKFATPVSKSEVTMDNDAYQTVTDPSAFVKFKITSEIPFSVLSEPVSSSPVVTGTPHFDRSSLVAESSEKNTEQTSASNDKNTKAEGRGSDVDVYLLAWTTTPWTLPANMCLAVNPDMEYCAVKVWAPDGVEAKVPQPEVLILAKSRVEAVLKGVDYEIIKEGIKGSELIGLTYEPLCATVEAESKLKDTWTVLGGDFVSDEDGTGIVHIAPAYGEDDYKLSLEHAVNFVDVLDEYGYYLPEVAEQLHEWGVRDTDEQGIEIWAANKFIAKCLEERGLVWKIEYIQHEYPFNPRSKQRIIYRAFPSWFFDVQGQKELMIAQNENINWFPAYLKHGRFEKNIEQAPDWNLSRDRFWATAMPVWKGDKGSVKVVGSYDELYELSGVRLEDYHRPWVDEIEFDLPVRKRFKSVIMGCEGIDDDLRKLGVEFTTQKGEFGTEYFALIPEGRSEEFEQLIIEKMQPDFFNDRIVDGRGVFVFKRKNGEIERYVWSETERGDEKRIGELIAEMTGSFNGSIRKLWEETEFYGKTIMEKTEATEHFKRIDKVLDCWFESGSMPFAQLHYPFENKEKFERNYPADFIVEYVGQVRAWFYYVHAVNTALASVGAFGSNEVSSGPKIKLGKDAKILFVCYGNINRSQAAKALYNKFIGTKLADSAGLDVKNDTGETIRIRNERVGRELGIANYRSTAQDMILDTYGIDITDEPRTQLTPEMLNDYDLVVNIAEKGQTPSWLRGKNVIWWDVKDPGLAETVEERKAVAKVALKEIERRVRDLVNGKVVDDGIDQIPAQLNAFKNVITTGTLAGNDGRKMSKSLGNYTDPNVLMNQYSADALRFLLLSSPVLSGEDFALTDKDVSDVQRKLAMIWNVYDFFTMYAEVDGWDSDNGWRPDGKLIKDLKNPLDRWIIARMYELKAGVIEGMEEYNIPKALEGVLPFVDDLSNWFVRRSRRRFWKSEDDGDKKEAYWTLYTVLERLARVLAPFTPFLAEELYQNLTGSGESVHLTDYPQTTEIDDPEILEQMARVRAIITEGLAMRMAKSDDEQQVKVRQPLGLFVYAGEKLPDWAEEIIRDELNVKQVEHGAEMMLDKTLTDELKREGFVRELIRAVQSARKKAGLQVDDRIKLSVSCDVPEEWAETLKAETLTEELVHDGNFAYDEIAKVNGEQVTVSLEKVG